MQVRLLFHVVQEMRLLSSIIKQGRILQETTIRVGLHTEEPTRVQSGVEEMLVAEKEQINLLIQEAHENANSKIEEAKVQAKEILKQALDENEMIKTQLEETIKQSQIACQDECGRLIEVAKGEAMSIVEQAQIERAQLLESAEPEMVEIIEQLLTRIIGDQITSTKWIEVLVKKMILKEDLTGDITIYVASSYTDEECSAIETKIKQIHTTVNVKEKEDLKQTTCIVETALGSIQYDVADGLEQVLREIHTLKTL